MPLNYLGLAVEYRDIARGLPDEIINSENVRGVITCFPRGTKLDNPKRYIAWSDKIIQKGKQLVIMCDPGIVGGAAAGENTDELLSKLLKPLGLQAIGQSLQFTPEISLVPEKSSDAFLHFEGPALPTFLPVAFTKANRQDAHVLLSGCRKNGAECSDLVVLNRHGGYVAADIGIIRETVDPAEPEARWWFLNPFLFFRNAFKTDDIPAPDVTTHTGRRIFYSLASGSGISQFGAVEKSPDQRISLANVLKQTIADSFPNLILTVAPVVGEVDSGWSGIARVRTDLQELFGMENIESASNTYSEPWQWNLLEKDSEPSADNTLLKKISLNWPRPRRYEAEPFSVQHEVEDSRKFLTSLTPEHRMPSCLVWSGDKRPFNTAIQFARAHTGCTIGGGLSRFDAQFPSYAWLEPLAWSWNNKDRVPYFSLTEESHYLHDAEDPEYSFGALKESIKRTEAPYRIKPFAIGFNFAAGLSPARLNTVKDLFNEATHQEVFPLGLNSYVSTVEGFFSTKLDKCGDACWIVHDRGALSTLRLDDSLKRTVDMQHSLGVIGYRTQNESLYISLDPSVKDPKIILRSASSIDFPSLIESRWNLSHASLSASKASFLLEGGGTGTMSWRVPWQGPSRIVYRLAENPSSILNQEELAGLNGIIAIQKNLSKRQIYRIDIMPVREV